MQNTTSDNTRGPVLLEISPENDDWNKRALELSASERIRTQLPLPELRGGPIGCYRCEPADEHSSEYDKRQLKLSI